MDCVGMLWRVPARVLPARWLLVWWWVIAAVEVRGLLWLPLRESGPVQQLPVEQVHAQHLPVLQPWMLASVAIPRILQLPLPAQHPPAQLLPPALQLAVRPWTLAPVLVAKAVVPKT